MKNIFWLVYCCAFVWGLGGALASGVTRGAEPVTAFRTGNELTVELKDLDQRRLRKEDLRTEIRVGDSTPITFDWRDPVFGPALAIDVTGVDRPTDVVVKLAGATHRPRVATLTARTPTFRRTVAIEKGSQWSGNLPVIHLPDSNDVRVEPLGVPKRTVTLADITFPVVSDRDLPILGSQNCILLVQGSLYASYRKADIDPKTLRVTGWRKFLVEIPVDPRWGEGTGDEVITLPAAGFRVHTTTDRAPNGLPMLGDSQAGLAQGGQSADTDDTGRIYFSNVERGAGVVRFDPASKRFEQPPVNFPQAIAKLLPPDPQWRRSWDTALSEMLVMRGRVYLVFARHYRVPTSNGNVEVCSGVVSIPQDHWQDAARFADDVRLHAGCWPGAPHRLYQQDVVPNDYASHKMAAPVETERGMLILPAKGSQGGPWELELDQQGNLTKVVEGNPAGVVRLYQGLRKQRLINVGGAGRAIVQSDCGELRIERRAIPLLAPTATKDALVDARGEFRRVSDSPATGTVTIRFDVTSMNSAARTLVVQGPTYAVTPIPGEPDQAIGVCEYGYYFSRLDFSQLASQRQVRRSYLPPKDGSAMPLQVGLGPYNSLWVDHDDASWLYVPGYIGLTRLKYADSGKPLDHFQTEMIYERLQGRTIDGAKRDGIKDYRELIPALGGRLLTIGRGRPGRGGGALSSGLELFDPRTLGPSEVSVWMARCFDLTTPVSRVIASASDGKFRQRILAGSSAIRPDYVRDLSPPSAVPANQEPKIFVWECDDQGHLRDLFGFALPRPAQVKLSPCGQYAVMLQDDGTLMTFSLAKQAVVEATKMAAAPLEFSRPGETLWAAPNGQLFVMTAQHGVSFYEVRVDRAGRIDLRPHLAVSDGTAAQCADVVHCFLPDLRRNDGTYDLVLGARAQGDDPSIRVVRDFISAK